MQKDPVPRMEHPLLWTCVGMALLFGCAPLQWYKAGTAQEDITRDQTSCTATARNEAALRRAPIRAPAQVVSDPQGRVVAIRPDSADSERFALEQDLIRRCMQNLGYVLQPRTSPP